jgi:hypothetical protein
VTDLFKDVLSDVGVDRRQRVVEQVEVGVVVDCPGQADALLLAAGQVDPLLADLRLVPAGQDVQVGLERARFDDLSTMLL